MKILVYALLALLLTAVCTSTGADENAVRNAMLDMDKKEYKTATFAGGCFWCMEPPFEKTPGVIDVVSGYAGGRDKDPTYEEVSSGATGHYETIEITYDPQKVTYAELLDIFWRQIDPTDAGGSFVDRGQQYGSAIFYRDEEERIIAEESKKRLADSGIFKAPIVTEIKKFEAFYKAEDYHQDYYKKSTLKYKFYRLRSGRDGFIEKVWKGKEGVTLPGKSPQGSKGGAFKKPPDEELRARLTPLQYEVTQREGTESAYENEYWDNKREGIYVDIVSGEPLFSSADKYDSRTGWPSFTKPLSQDNLVFREDRKFFSTRIEVRSKAAGSHLGHVFDDGPLPTGKRYCMNSAALRFVPKEDMDKEGYGEFQKILAPMKNKR